MRHIIFKIYRLLYGKGKNRKEPARIFKKTSNSVPSMGTDYDDDDDFNKIIPVRPRVIYDKSE